MWPCWLMFIAVTVFSYEMMTASNLGHTVVAKNVACKKVDTGVDGNGRIYIKLDCNGNTSYVPTSHQVLTLLQLPSQQTKTIVCDKLYADKSVDDCKADGYDVGLENSK